MASSQCIIDNRTHIKICAAQLRGPLIQFVYVPHDAPPSESRLWEIRFDGGSVFGFLKSFRFFDLPASRSESTATGFGIRSVSVGNRTGNRSTGTPSRFIILFKL